MEYLRRAVYGPQHPHSHMMHDAVHVTRDGLDTACGKKVDHMWFVVREEPITCKKCLANMESKP